MLIHELKRAKGNKRKSPRVGRGGKRGTTAGRGTKGQKARAGHRIRPAIRDLVQRLPKRRGFGKNRAQTVNSEKQKARALNVSDLQELELTTVSKETLREAGVLKRGQSAKILGNGEITSKVSVEGLAVSASAKEKIEKAGGTVKEGSKKKVEKSKKKDK